MSDIETNKTEELCRAELSDYFDTETCYNVPSVNIKENEKEFKIELAAPGFNKNDFHVNVEDNVLTITVEDKKPSDEENELYTKKEFNYNSFYRSFMLPLTINSEAVDAKYADGILKLCIPKKEEAHTVAVKEIVIA